MGLVSNFLSGVQQLIEGSVRAPFSKQYPGGRGLAANRANAMNLGGVVGIRDNGYEDLYANAAGTDLVAGCGVDSLNNFTLSEEQYAPMYQHVKFNLATAASLVNQQFFIAPSACRIVAITEIHATAESTAATMTMTVEKLTGTTAAGSGTAVMGTFNCKGTANTLQTATLSTPTTGDSTDPLLQLAAGDRLGVTFSTAGTELAGVVVTVTVAPNNGKKWVTWSMNANAGLTDQAIFIANRDYIVEAAYYVHGTKGTGASDVVQLVKDTGTNAPGAGTDLLTNNTNTGWSTTAANNTVQTGALVATAATVRLAPGDRLSLDWGAAVTSIAGVAVTVVLQATARRKEVTFALAANGSQAVDQSFFTADRNYQITDASCVFSVTAGGASKLQLVRDTGTTAPGAGTDLLSNNTNAGFDLALTANTVQVATWIDTRFNYLMAGDRLSVDYANAAGNTAGVVVTVSLIPV